MVAKMASHVLENDKAYAPFEIVMLEEKDFKTTLSISLQEKEISVLLGGTIDRVDSKEGTVRIIDYKTGRDENSFASIASLFDRQDDKRNKAAFQAMLYAWVYSKKSTVPYQLLRPRLINRKEIFKKDFEYGLSMGKELLQDVSPLLPEFEEHLIKLLTELFDPAQPFDQTEKVKTCAYCAYRDICHR
jgi:ATP-dependent helicase/DNAse subunit B